MSVNLGGLYRAIIDDVVRNVQRDFEEHGIDESVLNELKRSWDVKVAQMRVVDDFPLSEGAEGNGGNYPTGSEVGATLPSDGNGTIANPDTVNNQETSNFGAASLASLVDPNQIDPATHLFTLAETATTITTVDGVTIKPDIGALPPALSSPTSTSTTTNQGASHHDTGTDTRTPGTLTTDTASNNNNNNNGVDTATTTATTHPTNEVSSGTNGRASARKARRLNDGSIEPREDEDAINSDLDDSDEDTVTRTKNKWKCVLKDGVMTMDGRDYVFHRANGDFEW
ncbi:transcription factor IIA, alpha/beta subunit [Syncephalis plumigaleata]|nr:transcription factor IIA, alpha/beta subunit [Syncephalis plumigaleata]